MLAFICIPVVQRSLDTFRTTVWNNTRGRKQRNKELPTGVPEHIHHFPEKYGGESFGIPVSQEQLEVIAEDFDVFNGTEDYIDINLRCEFERHVSTTDDITPSEASVAYRFLKSKME